VNEPAHIVKHGGKRPSESFDAAKLRSSIIAACLSVRTPEGEAETLADRIVDHVSEWLEKKAEVTSNDLRRVASFHLTKYHPEAAYLYEQHTLIM
jgi:transcriptional regulator NrdR family protein